MSSDEQFEGALTFARIGELDDNPVNGNFDAAHLKEVHRRIFQDLPHHAPGEYRPDAPSHIKARALERLNHRYHVHYAPRSKVESGVEKVLAEFGGPSSLRGLDTEQFSARMAKLYGDLDYFHPFKEGNSRTLRVFTAQLAREAGYEFHWNTTNADAISRDRLYIARDKEVMQRAFPSLDQEWAMKTESRVEYEAYTLFIAPFSRADTLQKLIKESVVQAAEISPSSERLSVARDAAVELLKSKKFSQEEIATVMRQFDKRAMADLHAEATRSAPSSRNEDLER